MTTIQSWRGLRTLGALRQALIEAERTLPLLEGGFNSDEVYVEHDGSPECSVHLIEVPLSDGSKVYNVHIHTGD